MKKLFLLAVMMLCITSLSTTTAQVKFGIKGGANFSTLKFKPVQFEKYTLTSDGDKHSLGSQFGIMLKLQIPKFLYLQPELMYSNSTANLTLVTSTRDRLKLKYKIVSFEIPIMIGFNVGIVHFNAGPVFKIRTKNSVTENPASLTMNLHKSQIGYQVGGGIHFKGFTMDVRYGNYFKNPKIDSKIGKVQRTITTANYSQISVCAGLFF